ncbi:MULTISPECIES: hypothetical protein [Paenarthrobacter]|jgi:hypothetical protein|uniref:DNA mismatch repair proteins mutS family domain-containing protein n=1 Tax=Paenarthrobacter ureafaciens TaxID=37931 RepID=A0AAX3ECW6_PAEUR|nr:MULTISPECIES: hypothetical protein [Paenarthrobacter]MDO5865044.1 hypothetical protein [Paenarthrobacter sp. SD-2]MDO5876121.1 hypothetical protein [Paenarthrobacter sp. SD-1]QMU82865.1 DNA mismatch repair protein MutS [Paenarthrobacter ureafaciens]UYV91395.1 hypothetical protein NL395_12605 [Paenarthrobacter ureafaciens]UYV95915.1 hypothetical protein NL394_12550 [Paenarthrobacter ureafaciens]
MKAFLLYRDSDPAQADLPLPPNAPELINDLALNPVIEAMADGDEFLRDVALRTVMASMSAPDDIIYRQQILVDCLEHPGTVRKLYGLAVEAVEAEKKIYRSIFNNYPEAVLGRSIESLNALMAVLRHLRRLAADALQDFTSPGMRRFFTMITDELSDEYFDAVDIHLRRLKFRGGVEISAGLGTANEGAGYRLRRSAAIPGGRLERLLRQWFVPDRSALSFQIPDRDEGGYRALSTLRDRGLNLAANALAQADDHIVDFFKALRNELGFYVACLNLRERLEAAGAPLCLPKPEAYEAGTGPVCSARELGDPSLALAGTTVTGNDLPADGKTMVIITGANQGGKSTFLRAVGLAQLMMQAGMFVCADYFSSTPCDGLHTHFKREEDASLTSGKLEEELARMNTITDRLTSSSIVLFNESFAATNEREGSDIARDVILALTERGVRVFFVTHLFDLAHSLFTQGLPDALFLQAERREDGQRTYKLQQGEPTATSYGKDLYLRIFANQHGPAAPGTAEERRAADPPPITTGTQRTL